MSLAADGFTYLGSLEVPSLGGATASGVPAVIKNADFTAAMLASLKTDGGDLRLSSDLAGDTQLPIEVVDDLNIVWTLVPSVAATIKIYVWGNKPAATQPAADAAFGSEAVWVGSLITSHSLATDSSGNANTPSAVGGVTIGGSTSPIGGATNFDGTNDVVNYGNTASATSEMSISALINLDTYGEIAGGGSNRYGRIIRKGGNYDLLSIDDGNTTKCIGFANTRSNENSIPLNTWLYVDVTINSSGDVEYYVDGVPAGSATSGILGSTNTDNLAIGNFDTTNAIGRHTNGDVAELSIYNTVITPDQISIKYQNQSAAGAWWIAEDAVGGGFNPIWATNINQLIQ